MLTQRPPIPSKCNWQETSLSKELQSAMACEREFHEATGFVHGRCTCCLPDGKFP